MTSRMAGKVAIISGGGGGIGAATGELFCAQGAGVLLVDRDAQALEATLQRIRAANPGARVDACSADITDHSDAAEAARFALEKFGRLDVLVNNAAVRNTDTIVNGDSAEWERVFGVNVIGALNLCRAALPALRKSGRASVVNVSSCYAVRGRKGFAAYDASKAALLAMTNNLAAEEAEHGIRVNAVCPGGTLTPFTIGRGRARGKSEDEMRADTRTDSLLARWAEPIEVAYPILFLASDEASYITGATLMVDGGAPAAFK